MCHRVNDRAKPHQILSRVCAIVAKSEECLLEKRVKALFDVGKRRLGFVPGVLLTVRVLADLFVVSVQARCPSARRFPPFCQASVVTFQGL